MRKRYTIHYIFGHLESWATWHGKNENEVQREFLAENPKAEIISITQD